MALLLLGSLGWSESSARGVTGSLLDDNQWHDVELIREDKNITVSVDRVPVNITVDGEFKRLDLDRYVSGRGDSLIECSTAPGFILVRLLARCVMF